MSDSLLSLYRPDSEVQAEEGPLPVLPARREVLSHLKSGVVCDLIIIGGGLSGVTVAREAALRGSDVLLVEPGYFGERSWSWREALESILAKPSPSLFRILREAHRVTTTIAPHLASTVPWRDPRPSGLWGGFVVWASQREWRVPGASSASPVLPVVDERLLVRETALAARQEGALVMSAATASYVERDGDAGGCRVGVRDLLGDEVIEVKGRALFVDPTFPGPIVSRLGTPYRTKAPRSAVPLRGGIVISQQRVPWDIYSLIPKILSQVPSCGTARTVRRPLPGEWRPGERETFVSAARSAGVKEATIDLLIQRWRARARYILHLEGGCEEISPGVLHGEISLAHNSDQISSIQDLIYGALAFQAAPDGEVLARLSHSFSGMGLS